MVEERRGELAPCRGVDFGVRGGAGRHGLCVLRADLAEDVEHALEAEGPRLHAGAVTAQEPALFARVVGSEQLTDRLERDLQVTQSDDLARQVQLRVPVEAVARRGIDPRGSQQVEFVVVAERADAQPGQPGEPPDLQQVVHARIVNPRATRGVKPGGSGALATFRGAVLVSGAQTR
jgi:hypothetical protein